MLPARAISKFWSTDFEMKGSCWFWKGSKLPSGYGRFCSESVSYYAHRFSYMLHYGPIPDVFVVMHACDNPSCVNPDHLSTGTQAENRIDCMLKGRNPLNGNQLKTHCKRNHELTGNNVRFTGRGNQRVCRVCERARLKKRAQKRRDDRAVNADAEEWV